MAHEFNIDEDAQLSRRLRRRSRSNSRGLCTLAKRRVNLTGTTLRHNGAPTEKIDGPRQALIPERRPVEDDIVQDADV